MELVSWLVISALLVVPLWRIFNRVGMNPALSLLAVIPMVGLLAAVGVLAFGDWPKTRRQP